MKRRMLSKIVSLSLVASMTMPTFARMPSVGSDANDIDSFTDNTYSVVGLDLNQGEKTEYQGFDETDCPDQVEVKVYASLSSAFSVIIPKTVILSGTVNSDNKNVGQYTVDVQGDMAPGEKLFVVPDSTFLLSQVNKRNVNAEVKQDKTIWEYNELGSQAVGTITSDMLSAGQWNGTFNFNITQNVLAVLDAFHGDPDPEIVKTIEEIGKEYDKICSDHEFDMRSTKNPTCEKIGYDLMQCIKCGKPAIEIKEELGHDIKEVILVEPNCIQEGKKECICQRAKCDYDVEEVIPKSDHTYEAVFYPDTPATCTTAGVESRHCKYCEAKTDQRLIPALGHDWDTNGNIIKEAGITKPGLVEYPCTRCDAVNPVDIPRTGKSLEATSWETIDQYVELHKAGEINLRDLWSVGDTKTFKSKVTGNTYKVRIIGFDHDNYATQALINKSAVTNPYVVTSKGSNYLTDYASSASTQVAPITFECMNILDGRDWGRPASNTMGIYGYFNTPSSETKYDKWDIMPSKYNFDAIWPSNNQRTYNLAWTYKNVLPDDMRNVIDYACKTSKVSYNSTSLCYTADKLFMLSMTEYYGSSGTNSASNGATSDSTFEGKKYEIYKNAGTWTISSYDILRKSRVDGSGYSSYHTRTIAPTTGNKYYHNYMISGSGSCEDTWIGSTRATTFAFVL